MQRKIVIVDDDYGIQDVAKLLFEKAGYYTIVLASPQPLYEQNYTDADIILIDRQLCGFDGLDVCKDLKAMTSFSHTPMLLMSATSRIPDNFASSHADGFIEKPFQKKTMFQKIEELLPA